MTIELFSVYVGFLILTGLALASGVFLGLIFAPFKCRFSPKLLGGLSFGVSVLTFYADLLSNQFESGLGLPLMASALLVSLSFLLAAVLIQSQRMSSVVVVLMTCLVGGFWGVGLVIPALSMMLVLWLMGLLRRLYFPRPLQSEPYCLTIELLKYQVLGSVESLLDAFDVDIVSKSLVRRRGLHLELTYMASPLLNHLLLKRLFQLKGVGKVVKI